ncbi:MAG: helix-turn-helix domain-containing protein [Clostridia bacterium]|nr:helix-turn-helix domain-containing protein [Clostridia bacterium]
MKDIKTIIANNLVDLRKQHNLTQNDLAKKLNYSDNTISRWEHAEVTPSIETLQIISEFYSVPLESLLKEKIVEEVKKDNKNIFINKLATTLLTVSTVWFIAILAFIYMDTFLNENYWQAFIWALPASCLVLLSFNKYWRNKIYTFVVLSAFIWTLILSLYLQFLKYNVYLIFIVGVPIQVALSIWTFLKKE